MIRATIVRPGKDKKLKPSYKDPYLTAKEFCLVNGSPKTVDYGPKSLT